MKKSILLFALFTMMVFTSFNEPTDIGGGGRSQEPTFGIGGGGRSQEPTFEIGGGGRSQEPTFQIGGGGRSQEPI